MAPNIYAYRARYLLSQYEPDDDDSNESKDPGDHEDDEKKYPKPTLPVCIIGAGMAGLYTAMIFDSLEIDYQIVDADTRDRIGGRLFTHKFSDVPYDYFVCRIPVFSHRVLIFAHRKLGLCGSQMYHS